MKKIGIDGFLISSVDKKALDHYLIVTPTKWAENAVKGMINKSITIILKDWLSIYKNKQSGSFSTDLSILIPEIIEMEEFKKYNIKTPELEGEIEHDEVPSIEIWENGFDIQDYELKAMEAYYENPLAILTYFMKNKIYQRRKRFVKDHIPGFIEREEEIPDNQDDFINLVCNKPEYKNRLQLLLEEEI